MKIQSLSASLMALLLFSSMAQPDQIKTDDLVVPGHMCIGVDCPSSITGGILQFDFGINTLLLQENNLRIRFIDTSAPDQLGQSWRMFANERTNGGRSVFGIEMRSLTMDRLQLSDGTAPLFDCTVPTNFGVQPPIIGVIENGMPVIVPVNQPIVGGGPTYLWICDTVSEYTSQTLFSVDRELENGAALGSESESVADAISIGGPGMLRQLKNVAAGLGVSSMLVKKTMDDYSSLPDQRLQVQMLSQQLANLEAQLELIEDEVFSDSGGGGGSFDAVLILALLLLILYPMRRPGNTGFSVRAAA